MATRVSAHNDDLDWDMCWDLSPPIRAKWTHGGAGWATQQYGAYSCAAAPRTHTTPANTVDWWSKAIAKAAQSAWKPSQQWTEATSVSTPRSPWSEVATTTQGSKSPSLLDSSPGSRADWMDRIQTTTSPASYQFNFRAIDAGSDTDSDNDDDDRHEPGAFPVGDNVTASFEAVFAAIKEVPVPSTPPHPSPHANDEKLNDAAAGERVLKVISLDDCLKVPGKPAPKVAEIPTFPFSLGLVKAIRGPPGLAHPAISASAAAAALLQGPPTLVAKSAVLTDLPSTLKLTKGDRLKLVPPEREYAGVVKMINEVHGYSFVACPEVRAVYGRDVYLAKALVPAGIKVGDRLDFFMSLSSKGRPMATKVSVV